MPCGAPRIAGAYVRPLSTPHLTMPRISDDTTWKALTFVAATGASLLTHSLLKRTWVAVRGTKPPTNPAARETAWSDALLWTAASSLAGGIAKLAAKRHAGAYKAGDVPVLGGGQ